MSEKMGSHLYWQFLPSLNQMSRERQRHLSGPSYDLPSCGETEETKGIG